MVGQSIMTINDITVALAQSKKRNYCGMVGIQVDTKKNIAYIRMAKQWQRTRLTILPADLKQIYHRVKWHTTFADHNIGLHLIRDLENKLQLGIHTITTQKHPNDAQNIDRLQTMDMTEMVQLTLSLKQDRKIQWPARHGTDMAHLIKQMKVFAENVTAQGTVACHSPGDELDTLLRALMIALFANRIQLQQGFSELIIKKGSSSSFQERKDDRLLQEEKMLAASGCVDSGQLSRSYLNTMSRSNLFRPRKW